MTDGLREKVRALLTDGLGRHRTGDRSGGAARYLEAATLAPAVSDSWHLLGVAALELGLEAAARPLSLATALTPASGVFLTTLAHAQFRARRPDRALPLAMRARKLAPDHVEARMAEGMAAMALGRAVQASAAFRAVLDAQPANIAARTNLAVALQALGKVSAALEQAQVSLSRAPDQPAALAAAATGYILLGRPQEAISLFETARQTSPDAVAIGSNILFTLAYDETQTAATVAEAARAWGRRHAPASVPAAPIPADHGGPLRVGYLSQDFRDHPVGRNTLPVIAAHDPAKVAPHLYALKVQDDAWSQAAWSAGVFRDCSGLDDDRLDALIRADSLDVLVVIAGHTAHGRPLAAARRPAPVQVWWHDLQPSGLASVDYRIGDAVLTGVGADREAGDEAAVLLPCFYCHEVPREPVDPVPPPCLRAGYPVFGSLNNPAKLSDGCLALWRDILEAVPTAHLMVKYKRYFQDPGIQARVREALGPAGSRLVVLAADDDRERHLDVWNRIDIALDPFPFNGSTTSFEALWMGVPVVSLRGDRFVSRVGASLLTALGREDWIAETPGDYVRIVRDLLGDPDGLARIRRDLRQDLVASDLMAPRRHAGWLEAAYAVMVGRARRGAVATDIPAAELTGASDADR